MFIKFKKMHLGFLFLGIIAFNNSVLASDSDSDGDINVHAEGNGSAIGKVKGNVNINMYGQSDIETHINSARDMIRQINAAHHKDGDKDGAYPRCAAFRDALKRISVHLSQLPHNREGSEQVRNMIERIDDIRSDHGEGSLFYPKCDPANNAISETLRNILERLAQSLLHSRRG
jgi:hypothetical protein